MYLSMNVFNAHLEDGPVKPLATWLYTLGRERCLLLREVNIWDLHMLNASLHGRATTMRVSEDGQYLLRAAGREHYHWDWWLNHLGATLKLMGLGLARFCKPDGNGGLSETSRFAILDMHEGRGSAVGRRSALF